ncbi:hypothetical protein D8674_006220 [Pyrus ussuriensis x Pyrus communis]|uniref:Uncharacterized protein n=1 Tax=Pyrus ussuriensis x Pyrus communis TaxID=2448454 RepID=A0A5N5FU01_9ROSA|nr:hypothetical protein D8674_006220 [Pyrus ussuriensis x Pyrus communis]
MKVFEKKGKRCRQQKKRRKRRKKKKKKEERRDTAGGTKQGVGPLGSPNKIQKQF